ncbi:DUF378 domain-containing protein [Sedimentisphaera salicampi]|uniref:DUF378 domain-containing protein n=1 Tax=Sedimentisphaera salicampi TaxID=1941349 RepID=A0A1W6LQD8_9BACT|nr:DUF378 domain-containing protein [Sedimentisphaera salicampi]ARN57987.1 hypothetical protein STSP1_02413 [Sedimentisphaera salicampi]OXU14152.1 hypothetical protein SMSP1_02314 [Sedimentisphaera salicampi]
MKLDPLNWAALILTVIGGLNWGLVGLFKFDLVATLFGDMSPISRAVYVVVALAALFLIFAAMSGSKKSE